MANKIIICNNCGISFESRKSSKYCSNECYKQKRKVTVTISCLNCQMQFEQPYRFRNQKYCSIACFNTKTKRHARKNLSCLCCNNEFEIRETQVYQQKYCSYDCFLKKEYQRESAFVVKQCINCGTEFTKKFTKRKAKFCSQKCATSGKFNGMFGKTFKFPEGRHAWNIGKTKLNDDRLLQLGHKISKIMKYKFFNGELSNKGENNPMFGRTADTMSDENLKNYSIAATSRIIRGVSGNFKQNLSGYYTSTKNKTKMRFRSSWELAAMMFFDHDENVIDYSYEKEIIALSETQRTIPDFEVLTKDGEMIVYEVKPTAMQNLDKIKKKLDLTRNIIENSGRKYVLIGDKEINAIKNILGQKFITEVEKYENQKN